MRSAPSAAAGLSLALALTLAGAAGTASADSHVDQLAVVVVGDGQEYANVAGPVTIQWIDSEGTLGAAAVIPPGGDGDQHGFTIGVDRDQAGALQQSADHAYVTLGGYDAPLGTGDVNGTEAPEILRVIARIGADQSVDTTTTLAGAYSERHVRGVASSDGTRYWTGGHGNDSDAPYQAGVFTIEHGGDDPTVVATDGTSANLQNNTRVPLIHDGQLYVSSDRSGFHGVNAVGSGLPTSESDLTLIAEPPAGSTIPHDFAFVGEYLYVAYTEGVAGIVKYEHDGEGWEPVGQYLGAFWNLTGRVADGDVVLYAVRGAGAGNDLVQVIDLADAGFSDATEHVLAVAQPNTSFRGVAFAPGFVPGDGPIDPPAPSPVVAWDVRVAGGVGNALSAVLGADSNPVATGLISDPAGADVTVEVTSDDHDVVAEGGIEFTLADDGSFTLAATPVGTGIANITVTVTSEDERVGRSTLAYWVSNALPDPAALAHVGLADASAAYDVGDGHFLVADDDSNQLRLFGPTFGEPVREFDFNAVIDHVTDNTFDLEGAARIDNTIYWVGSLGNSRSGNYWPHRDIVFATEISGSGADTRLEYVGAATGFRSALVDWDEAGEHGLGAGALQFARATTPGYSVEGPNSLNVEGATIAPDGTTLWLGFRSPLIPVAGDPDNDPAGDTAIIVGIENIAGVVVGEASITVGDLVTLDLDGRAIRDLTEVADGAGYLIAAGSADDTGNFALYGWTGDPDDDPVLSETPLGLEGWSGSYEAITVAPSLHDGTVIRVLQDVGTLDIYGTGTEAQDLIREHMKFVSHDYTLDFGAAFHVKSLELSEPEVEAGGTVTATASGFAPGEEITFTLYSDPVELGTAAADGSGTAVVELAIPADAEEGEHIVEAAAGSGSAEAPLTILASDSGAQPTPTPTPTDTPGPTPGTGPGDGTIPATGVSGIGLIAALAGLLLVVGLVARRRATS